jgi:hypothetical protein
MLTKELSLDIIILIWKIIIDLPDHVGSHIYGTEEEQVRVESSKCWIEHVPYLGSSHLLNCGK